MNVSRVTLHAPVASFRHPFFVTGVQPTHRLPPPSTIHGLCAAANGEWPDPRSFVFGIHFVYRSQGRDLEHQHITSALGSKTHTLVPTPGGEVRATTEITVQPVARDFLYDVTLVLYVPTSIGQAFRRPVYTMTLGRSQDLAEVVAVEDIALERPKKARIEHTLLPRSVRPCVWSGSTVLLSRHVSEPPQRNVVFAQYIVLHDPVFFGGGADTTHTFDRVDGIALDDLWSDPTVVDDEGYARGVWMHRLIDPS